MKKSLVIAFAFIFLMNLVVISADTCSLNVSLLNQDPYPAVPGDYVKVVFQLKGVENKACTDAVFTIVPEYPFSLNTGDSPSITIKGGTYTNNYDSFLMVPYKLRVDSDAIEGDNPLKVKYSSDSTITFEVLNSGENDVEALTLTVPKQDNIEIKGSPSNIIGSLDANDFTTTSFEATPKDGEITLILSYTDNINERRTTEEVVTFEGDYFVGRKSQEKSYSSTIIFILIIIAIVAYLYYRSHQKQKKKKKLFD